ncbi:MAG: hypothetical protein FJ083_05185 [Cyanobacteria bacterium K_Offshore_surface_m2_239]|nr:hypothetical protein [Cyanobacteria bacterium K_Offshore_surface_m2_239]
MSSTTMLIDPLPDGWRNVQLGDLCDRVSDSYKPVRGGDTPYIGLEHLSQGYPAFVGQGIESDIKSQKTAFRANDVLFGKLRPYLRKGAKAGFNGVCSTDILAFRAQESCDPNFLQFLIHSDPFIAHATATTTGVQHPRTSWPSLREFKLSAPPLSEQKSIAKVLASVQKAIEAQERIILTTTELKQALMQKLFSEGLRGEPQKETEIGLVPESWEVVELGDIAKIERGKFAHRPRNEPRFYGGEYPFVQTGDVSNCDGRVRSYAQTLNKDGLAISKMFSAGTILITIAANIGFTGILEFDSACPDSLIGITPNKDVHTEFLNYYLMTQQQEMDRLSPRGTQKNINIQFLKPWPIPMPSLEEQIQISDLFAAADHKIRVASTQRSSLQGLFRSLLHELMSSNISVTAIRQTRHSKVIVNTMSLS